MFNYLLAVNNLQRQIFEHMNSAYMNWLAGVAMAMNDQNTMATMIENHAEEVQGAMLQEMQRRVKSENGSARTRH